MHKEMNMRTFAILVAMLTGAAAQAQYTLDWNTLDGGGGESVGGTVDLAGTIGQPDAGSFLQPMAGGAFELVGGFWPVAGAGPCPADLSGDRRVDLTDL